MRLIPPFKYYRAKTLEEALSWLKGVKGKTHVVAGGTDFLVKVRKGQITPENIVDISSIKELNYIKEDKEAIKIGALTKHNEIVGSQIIKEKAHILTDAESMIGSVEIRNRGTIGGNLCNASPAADTAPPLMVLDAKLKILSQEKERIVSITEFFLGPGKTVLKSDEMLAEIQIPLPSHSGSCFMKLGRRNTFTLSVVAVAVLVSLEADRFKDVRIALGSVAPTPIRARKTEGFLVGKEASEEWIEEAAEAVEGEVKPITDVRGTAEYRTEMSKVLTKKAILEALQEIRPGG